MDTIAHGELIHSNKISSASLIKRYNLPKNISFFKLISYPSQPAVFFLFFIGFYIFSPLLDYFFIDPNPYMLMLAKISSVAAGCLLVGYYIVPKFYLAKPLHLFRFSGQYFVWSIFAAFLLLLFLVVITAKDVPLILAFKAADPAQLATSRAEFLKARHGIEVIFVYANAILTTSFLPYAILLSFFRNYSIRWYVLSIPYFYSFLFLEKAFFLKFILPFISFCSSLIQRPHYKKYVIVGILSIPVVLYLNTVISGFGSQPKVIYSTQMKSANFQKELVSFKAENAWFLAQIIQPILSWEAIPEWELKQFLPPWAPWQPSQPWQMIGSENLWNATEFSGLAQVWQSPVVWDSWQSWQYWDSWQSWQLKQSQLTWLPPRAICKSDSTYYSANFLGCACTSRIKFILWRTASVPVFTAVDSLKLFQEKYHGQLFMGSTSTLLSALMRVENVKFEREAFSSEWGQDTTETASANSVFIIEQFINFGWLGVILSSIFVGYMYALLRRSQDLALAAMSIGLSINLLVGGLIPTMLSGGFLMLFGILFFVKLDE